MTSWIILLIKQFIDIIKYILIGNAIFEDKHNKENKYTILFLVFTIIIVYLILYNNINKIWIELNLAICIVSLFTVFRNRLLNTIKIVSVSMLVNTILEQFIDLITGFSNSRIYNYEFIFINIIYFIVVIFITWLIKLIKLIYNKQYELIEVPWYIYMNIIFGFSATLFPLYVVERYRNSMNTNLLIITTIVAYINIIISLITIYLFIKNKNERDRYFLDNILKDKTLKLQENYYKKLIDNYSTIRRFKHDIKGHLNLINRLIIDSKYEKAKLYLNEISENIIKKDIYNTNNIYISTILNSFDEQFKEHKIAFELSYYITRKLKMNSMDICSLFYNLLLNAIEANLKIGNERYIKLYVADIKNNMVIKIINPIDHYFDIKYIQENITSKEDKTNHGFGLVTINNIINKYKGNIDYTIVKNALIIDIILINVLENKDH